MNTEWDMILLIIFGEQALPHIDNLGRLIVLRQNTIYVGFGIDYATFLSERAQELNQKAYFKVNRKKITEK